MRNVTINGKEYPVLAKYSAIKVFCDKKGIDLFEFPSLLMDYGIDKPDFKPSGKFVDDMVLLMLSFLERGAEVERTDLDLTRNDLLDWFIEGNAGVVYELIAEAQGKLKNPEAPQKEGQA